MTDREISNQAQYRYFVGRSRQPGAVALIREAPNGELDMWAPTTMLGQLILDRVEEPRWLPTGWPPQSQLRDPTAFAEIDEREADSIKASLHTSATLYTGPPR